MVNSNKLEDIIRQQEQRSNANLKEIEAEFRKHLAACIDTCKSLEVLALKEHRMLEAHSYKIKAEIYQKLLDSYSLSNSYNRP